MQLRLWILSVAIMLCVVVPTFAQTVIDFEEFGGPSVFTVAQPALTIGTATFSGGQLLSKPSGLAANQSVVYGTSPLCVGCRPSITIDFSKPVSNFRVTVFNGHSFRVLYTVGSQGGNQMQRLDGNFATAIGFAIFRLPFKNIRRVTILSSILSAVYYIDGVAFEECSSNVVTVTLVTNENCDPTVAPNCQPNIVRADATEATTVAVTVGPPEATGLDLTTDFGNLLDVTTDANGKATAVYTGGILPPGDTSTKVAALGATICERAFPNLNRIFNYNGFNFHESQVSNSDFKDSTSMNAAAIQTFFAAHGSFLARFFLVGTIGGFLDTNGNAKFDAGEPAYSASGVPVPLHAHGKSAAEIFATNAAAHGVNPKLLIATAQKENGLVSTAALPAVGKLNSAMGCGQSSNFVRQIQCSAKTLANRFADTNAFNRKIAYPFFFHATDGIQHTVTDLGRQKVGFAVNTAATYAQYRYTPFIQSQATGGGVWLFEKLWRDFGF